ncbi:MAG: DUF4832 domain-containing protein [Spirochaetales bacterium]|nr:DUF4832 domain-containing protein [Spirochaetales bacterium]
MTKATGVILLLMGFFFACEELPLAENSISKISGQLNYVHVFDSSNLQNTMENPLKGFVPFIGTISSFPHSMEYFDFPLSKILTAREKADFSYFETGLNQVAARGNQAVCRPLLDIPGEPSGIPDYLIKLGLKTTYYSDYGGGHSPDYEDPELIAALVYFINQWAKHYDGDPRIGFISLGLLGFWGEWHTWPYSYLFASSYTQETVISTYEAAFTHTKLLIRTPNKYTKKSSIGFHDDSFAFSTLPTTSWNFVSMLDKYEVSDAWQSRVIGGELRPEIQKLIWIHPESCPEDYREALDMTHVSWLINQTVFTSDYAAWPNMAKESALKGAALTGYDFFVSSLSLRDNLDHSAELALEIENKGIAPFYYHWPLLIKLTSSSEIIADSRLDIEWPLLMPKERITIKIDLALHSDIFIEDYTLWLKIENPMAGGKPLLLMNPQSKSHNQGWIALLKFQAQP